MPGLIYSDLKPFLYADRLRAISAGAVPAPVHVRILPASGANPRDRIPREKMLEIADDLIEMKVEAVSFSGSGEPLQYPHLVETVERLAAGGIRIGVVSNGSVLRGHVAEVLAQHATWIRVSMDGWDSVSYARAHTVGDEEFYRVLRNLDAFARRGSRCLLGAAVVVDARNASHLFAICDQLKRVGVREVRIIPGILGGAGSDDEPGQMRLRETVRLQLAAARALEDNRFRVNSQGRPEGESAGEPSGTRERCCPMVYLQTVIGADLTVYSCLDKAYTESGALGSIRARRFRDFWRSDDAARALAAIDPSRHCRPHCPASATNARILELMSLDPAHSCFV